MYTPYTTEQFASLQKAQIDSLLTLAHTAFAGMERLAALNLETARNLLDDGAGSARTLLSATDLQTLMTLQGGLVQPTADKLAAWSRSAYEIGATTRDELGKTLDARISEASQSLDSTLDELVKQAPAGTETATGASVSALKSALGAAGVAYATFSKTARQVGDQLDSQLAPAAKPAPKARKAA